MQRKQEFKLRMVKFKFNTVCYNGRIVIGKHPSGNTSVRIDIRTAWKKWEIFTRLSIDFPDWELPTGVFALHTTTENKKIINQLEIFGVKKTEKTLQGISIYKINPANIRNKN